MSCINLQRNSEVFFSTIDLNNGGDPANMTPSNTWKIEVLAGFALTSGAATQDITSLESGLNPDRSQARYNTAINPVDWNFTTYLRPTGIVTGAGADGTDAGTNHTGNVMPVADWFMWQSMASNTKVAEGGVVQSVWADGGKLSTDNIAASTGAHSSRTNFAIAVENHLYFKLDNVVYQVSNATVNQATVDAGIEEIATTTWTGFGQTLNEVLGDNRDNAITVFGGVLNDGSSAVGNANALSASATYSYHPYNQANVAGSVGTNSFLKNRLSAIEFHHQPSATGSDVSYTFPVTALSFDYNNNISYLTPEELSTLNNPIGQFLGTRAVTGSATMYLRAGDSQSAQFLRNIANDSRTNSSATSNANLIIGGTTAPYVAFMLPAAQFEFPTLAVEDVISMTVNFVGQQPDECDGGEVTIVAQK